MVFYSVDSLPPPVIMCCYLTRYQNINKNDLWRNKKYWKLYTRPELIDCNSFIGQTINAQHCIQIYGDLFETISLKIQDRDVTGTSAAVLRDLISLVLQDSNYGYQNFKTIPRHVLKNVFTQMVL